MAEPDNIYVPAYIRVHLGRPRENAENVTVSFLDYIKNVACSEIYPTWNETAIRTNIYCQVSFALNRIYTEWYPSRGYDFDITGSPAVDQAYVKGQSIFSSIEKVANEAFNDYIRREGSGEPLFAQYCDGKTATCDGLSQWGSYELSKEGYTPYQILTRYYGEGLQIIYNADIVINTPSYPGKAIRRGDRGDNVRFIQMQLNAVSRNYPSIPKIPNVDGVFGELTENAVIEFQRVFELEADGIVGKSTWYKLKFIYAAVRKLSELDSLGADIIRYSMQYKRPLSLGTVGNDVKLFQYLLDVVAAYNEAVPGVKVTGTFDESTQQSMQAFQRYYGLEITDSSNLDTFKRLYEEYAGIMVVRPDVATAAKEYPGYILRLGATGNDVMDLQDYLLYISTRDSAIPGLIVDGVFEKYTRESVIAFQKKYGLTPDGLVGEKTWNEIARVYDEYRNNVAVSRQYSGTKLV